MMYQVIYKTDWQPRYPSPLWDEVEWTRTEGAEALSLHQTLKEEHTDRLQETRPDGTTRMICAKYEEES